MIAESGAIIEYIINRYGDGRLSVPPTRADYARYLEWRARGRGHGDAAIPGAVAADAHGHRRSDAGCCLDARKYPTTC
ncbi:MAG: hypothetical protein WDN69_08600 [Aliidongia sp.]